MNDLIMALNEYPNGTEVIIEWQSGVSLIGEIDTIFETDNGLELEDESYEEYYSCLIRIISIENDSKNELAIGVGELLEVSEKNAPLKVKLKEKGDVIYP